MINVSFILLPNIMASSISLPLEMLNAADNIQRAQNKNAIPIKIDLAGETLDSVDSSGGLPIAPNCCIDDLEDMDLLLIPALWRNPLHTLQRNRWLVEWLRSQNFSKKTHICAVGTGSSFLAESNILHNKSATTHWFYYDLMRVKYPDVDWKRQHLITESNNIYCAGSINSMADLSIHFIQKLYGLEISKRVESHFSPEIRRAYQEHLFDDSLNSKHQDELIAASQNHIQLQFNENIDFAAMAAELNLSERSLQRRFKSACHLSPLQYQQQLRMNSAKQLLQNSNLSILEVATSVGYSDASHFSRLFKKHCQQSPKTYRNAVRGKLFNA